jgi:hypothetical protein
VLLGVIAFARRQYPATTRLLSQARRQASVFGGSHAQRDAIDLTLLAAAAAGGDRALDRALVRALVAERVARKPTAGRAAELVIGTSQARAARAGAVQRVDGRGDGPERRADPAQRHAARQPRRALELTTR